jgi:hypothetical protein
MMLVHQYSSRGQSGDINSLQLSTLADSLCSQIKRHYIDTTAIRPLMAMLRENYQKGLYSKISDANALAARLTVDIQRTSNDAHFRVLYYPEMLNEITGNIEDVPALVQKKLDLDRSKNFGFSKAEILPGNIGYLSISQFVRLNPYSKEAANTAFSYLKNTSAMVIDLRYGSGGSPEMMSFIAGKFFNKPIKLAEIYIRSEQIKIACTTQPDSISKYFSTKPLIILVSYRTFSAAEALAYTLQHEGRAVIIGETTRGGAHIVNYQPLSSGFVADIPLGTFISSATGTNWERKGIRPDVTCPHEDALYFAGKHLFDKVLTPPAGSTDMYLILQRILFEGRLKPIPYYDATRFTGNFSTGMLFMESGVLYHQESGRARTPMVVINDNWVKPAFNDNYAIELKRDEKGNLTAVIQYSEEGRMVKGYRVN